MKRALLILATAIAPIAALADPAASVRLAPHPGFGRVVFDIPQFTDFTVERLGDLAIVHVTGAGAIPGADHGTRNVNAVRGGASEAVIDLAPAVRIRASRMGNRIVVDVLDAPGRPAPPPKPLPAAAPTAAAPTAAAPTAAAPTPAAPTLVATAKRAATATPAPLGTPASLGPPATPARQPDPAPSPTPAEQAAPAPPAENTPPTRVSVAQTALPQVTSAPTASPITEADPSLPAAPAPAPATTLTLAAARTELPPGVAGSAVLLPFAAKVGAAAFRRGGLAWIVFDERRPIDMGPLHDDPILGAATVQLLTSATLVRVPLADGAVLRLARQAEGWAIAAIPAAAAALQPIIPVLQGGHLLLPSSAPGNIVAVPDPDTGQNLLVGTLRGGPPNAAAGLPVAYQMPQIVLQPSWYGLLAEPLSDSVTLHASPDGFVLETGDVALEPPAGARALTLSAFLTRRFDFPSAPPSALLRRLEAQVAEAGEAPPQSRARPRTAAAQTMIALGMGAEAHSVLRLATEEDPRLAMDPDAQGLSAVAALLSGRDAEAAALASPALAGTDEVAMWRAVRAAQQQEGSPEAAAVFAATLPLILAYPEALQNRLLPLAAETMALGGAPAAADALLTRRPDDLRLTYARALRLEAKGETAAALTTYDALAEGRNRFDSARAATRATLLRLSTGAMTPAAAATALEGQFLAWRGDDRERDLRLRVATLRAQSGTWRAAFDLLRETDALYPESAALIGARRTELLTEMLSSPAATIPAIDLVTLVEENAELVAAVAPVQITTLLADKLISLDLPRRAGPLLERMMRAAAPGVPQATLGARLAAVRFGIGDDAGAATALATSEAPDLPPPLQASRVMLGARITAHRGNPGAAAAALAALDLPAADELRATLLTDAQEWRDAQRAVQDLADKVVPASGPLDATQQDVLMRLATAQQRAGDTAALSALGKQAARMTGPRADMFRLLTAAPVDGVGDLRRASSEIALARSIPSALAAIGSK